MKLSQILTRSSLAAVALLNLSLATSAVAEPIVVTRGPNRAAHVVTCGRVPVDAKQAPMTEAREFPQLVQKGPGGAVQIKTESNAAMKETRQAQEPRLIRRGTHGAFTLSSK